MGVHDGSPLAEQRGKTRPDDAGSIAEGSQVSSKTKQRRAVEKEHTTQSGHLPPEILTRPRHPRGSLAQENIMRVVDR